jgi:hypothetical protein
MTAVLKPRSARPVAKLALVVVLPTPPLPDVTTTILVTFGGRFGARRAAQGIGANFRQAGGRSIGGQRRRQAERGDGIEAGVFQQGADCRPVCVLGQRLGLAEVKHRQLILEEVRTVAGQLRQGGVQGGRIGAAQLCLDDLERRALELDR